VILFGASVKADSSCGALPTARPAFRAASRTARWPCSPTAAGTAGRERSPSRARGRSPIASICRRKKFTSRRATSSASRSPAAGPGRSGSRDSDAALSFEATILPAIAETSHGRDALAMIGAGLGRGALAWLQDAAGSRGAAGAGRAVEEEPMRPERGEHGALDPHDNAGALVRALDCDGAGLS
jgi:hypothetical protein